jgi:large subunit ribosomal protein L19
MSNIISKLESKYKKTDIPQFKVGDTLKLHLRVIEGDSERIQVFEGDLIGIQGRGINRNIIVRKLSYGVGVERIIPLHSPKIAKIEIAKIGRVRRAKLYYVRDRVGKAARIKEKIEDNTTTNVE